MIKFRRTERVDVDLRIFFPDVTQQIQVVVNSELGVMTALHQNLDPADCNKLINLLIDLFLVQDVVIRIFFGPIKRTKFAINVADVGVVNVAINDICHDFVSATPKGVRLRHLTPAIRKLPQFIQGQAVQLHSLSGVDPLAIQNFIDYPRSRNRVFINKYHNISFHSVLKRAAEICLSYLYTRTDVSLTPFIPNIHCFATPIYLLEARDICFMEYPGI